MPWTRRSDDAYRDCVLAGLSDRAYRLRDVLLSRAGEVWEQEGRLTRADVRMAVAMLDWDSETVRNLTAELVATGVLVEVDGDWQIADYLDRYGRSAETWRKDRAHNAERQARYRAAHSRNGVTNGVTNGGPDPDPDPEPEPVPTERVNTPTSKLAEDSHDLVVEPILRLCCDLTDHQADRCLTCIQALDELHVMADQRGLDLDVLGSRITREMRRKYHEWEAEGFPKNPPHHLCAWTPYFPPLLDEIEQERAS